jgi:hypothetical protein
MPANREIPEATEKLLALVCGLGIDKPEALLIHGRIEDYRTIGEQVHAQVLDMFKTIEALRKNHPIDARTHQN